MTLTPEEKEYRLSIFSINCLAQSSGVVKKIRRRREEELCPDISIDSIYTSEDLSVMNGAIMGPVTPPQVDPETSRTKRNVSSFDINPVL